MTKLPLLGLLLSFALAAPVLAEGPDAPSSLETPMPGFVFAPDEIAAALEILRRQPGFADAAIDWAGIAAFYAEAGGKGLFVTAEDFSALGQALIQRLPRAVAAGLPIAPDLLLAVKTLTPPKDMPARLRAEVLLAVLATLTAIDAVYDLDGEGKQGARILAMAARHQEDEAAMAFVAREWPDYYRFWTLLGALPAMIAKVEAGGWPVVPEIEGKIEPGAVSPDLPAIRQRLAAGGDWQEPVGMTTEQAQIYDPDFVAAVMRFQARHGLNADGVIGRRSLEEMNIDAPTRLRQMLAALDTLRDLSMEPRHLVANIPAQEVKIVDQGRVLFYAKAIVGRIDRPSPILSSTILTVKLNPDWTAPTKIAIEDEARHERANPGFLAAKGFTVFDMAGNEVDPASIDWHEVRPGNFPYTLRQAPGPENALGPAKLDFPNPQAVYIHGTPAQVLFAKQDRYFSSGCIRVETPLDLAAFVLRNDPAWPRSRIDAVIASGKTTLIGLKSPLPVHLTYATAWVDEAGVLQFRKDMYKRVDLPEIPRGMVGAETLNAISAATAPTKGNSQ